MVREIRTREELAAVATKAAGYLYNALGSTDPKLCPIHAVTCRSVDAMLKVRPGVLAVRKLWAATLEELVEAVAKRGLPHSICGSEGLRVTAAVDRTATATSRSRAFERALAAARAKRVPEPAGLTEAEDFHVQTSASGTCVEVWSSYRLQFDSKPRAKALKSAIATAVRGLQAGDGLLEAVYVSPSRDYVDAENVLFYNVGTGAFAQGARGGLRFDRTYGEPPPSPRPMRATAKHYMRYRMVASASTSPFWRQGEVLWSAKRVQLSRLDALSKPAAVWLAVRSAPQRQLSKRMLTRYALDLTLHSGLASPARPADIVKPLVDGLVAALPAHDGTQREVVVPRLAAQLGVPVTLAERLLHEPENAVLGPRRLLWPRGDSVQWNPWDDACVNCTFRHVLGGASAGWSLDAALHEAEPA